MIKGFEDLPSPQGLPLIGHLHKVSAFIPFGFSPRLCPGKNLALLEMKLVLSMITRNFHVVLLTPPEEVREQMALTMMPESYGIKLTERE